MIIIQIKRAFVCLSATVLLLTACSISEDSSFDGNRIVDSQAVARIDSTLGSFIESGELVGVSALIFEKGEEVYFGAYGMADRENGSVMERNTIVQIFSMTKPITGVALMTLFEEGAFELDDPLAQHAPEFSNLRVYAGENPDGSPILDMPSRPVTIRDITRHTAGFGGAGTPGVGTYYASENPMAVTNTLSQMAEKLGRVPLAFHPEEQWSYGPSVDVQAFLVERLSGQPFDQYLQETIFDPLGMDNTGYVIPESSRDRLAAMYTLNNEDVLQRQDDESAFSFNSREWPLTPGGYGLVSTLDDYMAFSQMLLDEGQFNGNQILQAETVQLMATNHLSEDITERSWLPSKGQVGFGIDFAVRLRPPATSSENNGVAGEFFWDGAASTLFWVDPANELTAVLFVQIRPFDPVGLHKGFRDAVYGPVRPGDGE